MDEAVDLSANLISSKFSEFQCSPPPDCLYHYTDQLGLLGIIEKRELWATKVQYMNDSTEFGLAVELAKTRIKARMQRTKPQRGEELLNEAELLKAITGKLDH